MEQMRDQYRVRIILRHFAQMFAIAVIIAVMADNIILILNKSELPVSITSWRRVLADLLPSILYCMRSAIQLSHKLGEYDTRKLSEGNKLALSQSTQEKETPKLQASPYPFSWPSLEKLGKYVDDKWCAGVNPDYESTISTDFIENENLEEFKEDVRSITFLDNTSKKIWEYVWSRLVYFFNRNAKRQEGLDQRQEPYFSTLNVEFALYKYIAVVYTTSMLLPTEYCFENVLRTINDDFLDKRRMNLLREVAGKDEGYIKQFLAGKADQCERCLIHGCDGRFKRLSDKLIDLVGPYCDDDIKTEEQIREERRAERLANIYFPEEARKEMIANMSSYTPLQEITRIISHPYWKSLIEAYLRIMGVRILAKDGQQQKFSEMDFRIIAAECEENIDEFHRWRTLEHDFSEVVKRNLRDVKSIKMYFADVIKPLQSYLQYLYPSQEKYEDYKFSSALMRLAVSDNCPSLSTLQKIFPDIVAFVDERNATEHFNNMQYEDVLYRALYEKAAQTKNDIYENNSIFEISMLYEIIEHLCLAIDKALHANGLDFGFEEIQEYAGIRVVDDVKSLYDKYYVYDEDLFAVASDQCPSKEGDEDVEHEQNLSDEGSFIPFETNVQTKRKALEKKFNTPEVYALFSRLRKDNYVKHVSGKPDEWLKGKDNYAYFCMKFTEVFGGDDAQVEVKYISARLAYCDDNLETIRRYANSYKAGEKELPDLHIDIDNYIMRALKHQL